MPAGSQWLKRTRLSRRNTSAIVAPRGRALLEEGVEALACLGGAAHARHGGGGELAHLGGGGRPQPGVERRDLGDGVGAAGVQLALERVDRVVQLLLGDDLPDEAE